MAYIKAQKVLPKELIDSIQQYVDGEFLYIPRKNNSKKSWGEKNGTRCCIDKRNLEIFKKYQTGDSISKLSEAYFLAEKTIQKIVYEQKHYCK